MKNKNIFFVIFIITAGIILYSCIKENNASYFKGKITVINNFNKDITLKSKKIDLADINEGQPIVCDSFLIFITSKYPDYNLYAFDIKTRKHIASFCPKGNGPNDFLSFDTSDQLIKENGDSKMWVRDYNKQDIRLINITQSIFQQKTVCDSIISFEWSKLFQFPLLNVFFLDNGEILGINQCEGKYAKGEEYTPRDLYLFKGTFNDWIKRYHLYQRPVICQDDRIKFDCSEFYNAACCIKPDKTKLALAMKMLGQISIVDIKTGEQMNFRMKESITFPDIEKDVFKSHKYYESLAVSDKYIFATYVNVAMKDSLPPYSTHIIHVLTWDGRPAYKIHVNESIKYITLDTSNHTLYATDLEDNLYSYDISEIQ